MGQQRGSGHLEEGVQEEEKRCFFDRKLNSTAPLDLGMCCLLLK